MWWIEEGDKREKQTTVAAILDLFTHIENVASAFFNLASTVINESQFTLLHDRLIKLKHLGIANQTNLEK